MLCNDRPEPPADDGGIWRRLKPVDWPNQVDEEDMDRDLPQKLRAELPGIAQRVLAGWRDFRDNGLNVPEQCREAAKEWRSEVDVIGKFLDEFCDVDKANDQMKTKSSLLFMRWSSFAHDLNEPAGNNKQLTQALKRRGFTFKTTKHGVFAIGLELRQPAADQPFLEAG
jgi:putative DNA primase/helicase